MKIFLLVASCLAAATAQTCPEPDGFFSDNQQCDRYADCKDGVFRDELCPDGLVFNELLQKNPVPCSYPTEVDCGSRPNLQSPQPTENCGRAWGYFGSGNSAECGHFYNCVDGREFRFNCPEGLAFSEATYRCEWPDQSAECDIEAYLGFRCPAIRDEAQVLAVGIPRYASPRDCKTYFVCVGDSPRLNKCDEGLVFNDAIYGCDDPENVRGCEGYYPPEELEAIRKRKEARLLAAERRQRAFQERFAQLNSRN